MGVHFERGQVLFEMGRYREAAKEYLAELAEEPEDVPALIGFAASQFNCGDTKGAAETIERAITLEPEFAHSFCILGHVELRRGRIRKAKQAIAEAIRICPSAEYFTALARILAFEFNKPESIEATGTALQLDPTYVPAILLRGQLLAEIGRTDEANDLFVSALRESPREACAHQALGRMQLAKGRASSALGLLTEARRIDPFYANDRDAIAQAYGLNLPLFREVNYLAPRWHQWSFRMHWLLSVALTAMFSVMSLRINFEGSEQSRDMLTGNLWWIVLCVALTNYLLLPFTLALVARTTAYVVAKRQLDIGWITVVVQPISCFAWVIVLHVIAVLAGMVFSVIPGMVAIACAEAICYPLVTAIARSGARQLTYYVCLPLLILLSGLVAIPLILIAFEHSFSGYVFVGLYFAIAYYNERLARWASSVRLF